MREALEASDFTFVFGGRPSIVFKTSEGHLAEHSNCFAVRDAATVTKVAKLACCQKLGSWSYDADVIAGHSASAGVRSDTRR